MAASEEKKWLHDYFELYRESIFNPDIYGDLVKLKEILLDTNAKGKKSIIIGNGGSAAIASHAAVDLTKNARVRCVNFNEADLITCFSNDFGYEKCMQKALEFYADDGDTVILISSGGKSPNILNAADYALAKGLNLITFSGFSRDNPLAGKGSLNFCVNSQAYNIIESTHQIWLLSVCDLIIGKAEYPAS